MSAVNKCKVYFSSQVGAPASSSRAIAGLINRHQRPTSTTTPRSPGSSRSSGSQDSGLTVILDSPAMVFQPGEGSREGSSGGREGREYWSRERGELGELYTRENSRDSYWSRENRYLWETSFCSCFGKGVIVIHTFFVCVLFIRRVVKVLLSVLSVLGANPRLQPYGGAPPAPGFRRSVISVFSNRPFAFLKSPSSGITTHCTCLLRAFWTGPGLLLGTFWGDANWSILIRHTLFQQCFHCNKWRVDILLHIWWRVSTVDQN